ncbi:hypothetical protein EVAR_91883_1 [Eumeta japonica]|uniref:Uncharacterized protein n=1 Tax=Eumeta variegata TaxID=151549 RepID=A0A4C1TP15_EUMVA|nr:hypothetical protein EVAR_91883_1 [Eumeta japonica]
MFPLSVPNNPLSTTAVIHPGMDRGGSGEVELLSRGCACHGCLLPVGYNRQRCAYSPALRAHLHGVVEAYSCPERVTADSLVSLHRRR